MRRVPAYLLIFCLLLFSCVKEHQEEGSGIILRVQCDQTAAVTRAEVSGEKEGIKELKENYLKTIDFFFYKGGSPLASDEALLHRRYQSGSTTGSAEFRVQLTSQEVHDLFPENGSKVTVFALVNYPGDETFPGGTSRQALEALAVTTDFVLSAGEYVQPWFLMSGTQVITCNDVTHIVTATGEISLKRYACKMTVDVKVLPEVRKKKDDSSEEVYEVWEPILEDLAVYMDNAVKTVSLSGEYASPGNDDYFSYTKNRRKYVKKNADNSYSPIYGVDGETGYYYSVPMYMYPQHWHFASAEGGDREPYLKLVLPWARKADEEHGIVGTSRQFYYKIVLPNSITETDDEGWDGSFVRNCWYHMNIEVGYLGSDNDGASVPVDGFCYLVDWQDKNVVIKKATIGKARYLSVDKNEYELQDASHTQINYVSSHEVVIKPNSLRVTRPYYGDAEEGYNKDLGGTVRKVNEEDPEKAYYPVESKYLDLTYRDNAYWENPACLSWLTQNDVGSYFSFIHQLIDDYKSVKFDYSPYRIAFTLVHEDKKDDPNADYSQDIIIWQYPGVYIEAHPNSDTTFEFIQMMADGKRSYWSSENWGYVFVDNQKLHRNETPDVQEHNLSWWAKYYREKGYTFENDEDFHWRAIWYTGGSRDIFNINVTVIPQGTDFIIGDPRADEIDNLKVLPKTFHSAEALYYDKSSERPLRYYYPTESSSRTEDMLAPSYRIASKCGGVEFGGVTMEQALYRCATYQEDGFPAGRWRLPTKGEIKFIAMLSANKAFTFLFSLNGEYWSANGAIRVSSGKVEDSASTKALPRCVYDSWYWDDIDTKRQKEQKNRTFDEFLLEQRKSFVWGDEPR